MAATSSAPRAEPWAAPVLRACGAGKAIWLRSRMKDGRAVVVAGGSEARRRGRRGRGLRRGRGRLLHVPAVGAVAGRDVLGEGDAGVVLDGDAVVIPDQA